MNMQKGQTMETATTIIDETVERSKPGKTRPFADIQEGTWFRGTIREDQGERRSADIEVNCYAVARKSADDQITLLSVHYTQAWLVRPERTTVLDYHPVAVRLTIQELPEEHSYAPDEWHRHAPKGLSPAREH